MKTFYYLLHVCMQIAHGLVEDNLVDVAEPQLGDEECQQLGLHRQHLPCSSCNLLEKFELSQLGWVYNYI